MSNIRILREYPKTISEKSFMTLDMCVLEPLSLNILMVEIGKISGEICKKTGKTGFDHTLVQYYRYVSVKLVVAIILFYIYIK